SARQDRTLLPGPFAARTCAVPRLPERSPMALLSRRAVTGSAIALAALLAGCAAAEDTSGGGTAASDTGGGGTGGEATIEHAFGTTTIPASPQVITTVAWANHEVPLALGVVPAGMAAANFGDDDA